MLSKLTRSNQVTIPKAIVERMGLKTGIDYLDVEYREGVIYIKPVDVEERIPKETLEKFKRQVTNEEKGDITLTAKEAEGFLARRAKRK